MHQELSEALSAKSQILPLPWESYLTSFYWWNSPKMEINCEATVSSRSQRYHLSYVQSEIIQNCRFAWQKFYSLPSVEIKDTC